MYEKSQPTVSVHILENTPDEKKTEFIDDGLFYNALADMAKSSKE